MGKAKNLSKLILIIFFLKLFITNICLAFTVPEGFQIHAQDNGVVTYKSFDEKNYVHAIDMASGASIKFIVGEEDKKNKIDTNPKFYRKSLENFNNEGKESGQDYFLLTNGTYFINEDDKKPNRPILDPTPLAFSLKIDGIKIAPGYAGKLIENDILLLEVWNDRVDIVPEILPKRSVFHDSTAPNILGGYTETIDAKTRPNSFIGRTFAGVADKIDKKYKTLLILNSTSATQKSAGKILRDFGAEKIIMFDGGGSTQLIVQNDSKIKPDRTIPQAIAVLAGKEQNKFEIVNLDKSLDSICSCSDSDIENPNFSINLSLINRSEKPATLMGLSFAIHDGVKNEFLWNMFDPITGQSKILNNIKLNGYEVYDIGTVSSYFREHGNFILNVNAKINGTSSLLYSMPFTVLPTINYLNPDRNNAIKLGTIKVRNGTNLYKEIASEEFKIGNTVFTKGYPIGSPIKLLGGDETLELLQLISNDSESKYTLKISTFNKLVGYILRNDVIDFAPNESDISNILDLHLKARYEYEGEIQVVDNVIASYEKFLSRFPCSIFVPEALLKIMVSHIYTFQINHIQYEEKLRRHNLIMNILEILNSKHSRNNAQKEKINEVKMFFDYNKELLCNSKDSNILVAWRINNELRELFPSSFRIGKKTN